MIERGNAKTQPFPAGSDRRTSGLGVALRTFWLSLPTVLQAPEGDQPKYRLGCPTGQVFQPQRFDNSRFNCRQVRRYHGMSHIPPSSIGTPSLFNAIKARQSYGGNHVTFRPSDHAPQTCGKGRIRKDAVPWPRRVGRRRRKRDDGTYSAILPPGDDHHRPTFHHFRNHKSGRKVAEEHSSSPRMKRKRHDRFLPRNGTLIAVRTTLCRQ